MSKNEVKKQLNKSKTNKNKKQKFEYKKKVPKTTKLEENINSLKARYEKIDTKSIKTFSDLPISSETMKALKEDDFEIPTEIQKESIGLALQGHDILGTKSELVFLHFNMCFRCCQNWFREDSGFSDSHLGETLQFEMDKS